MMKNKLLIRLIKGLNLDWKQFWVHKVRKVENDKGGTGSSEHTESGQRCTQPVVKQACFGKHTCELF